MPLFGRGFVESNTDHAAVTAKPITGYPFTIASWFNPDTNAGPQGIVFLGRSDATNQYFVLDVTTAASDVLNFIGRNTTSTFAQVGGVSLDTWHHGVGIASSATDRAVILDGDWAGRATNTTSVLFPGAGTYVVDIGRYGDSSASNYMDGHIALPAVWDVALAQHEVEALAAGAWPGNIRPQSLVFFVPLGIGSPDPDWSGNQNNLTVTGSNASASGPPVALRNKGLWIPEVVSGGVTGAITTSGTADATFGAQAALNASISNAATADAIFAGAVQGAGALEGSVSYTAQANAVFDAELAANASVSFNATAQSLYSGAVPADLEGSTVYTAQASVSFSARVSDSAGWAKVPVPAGAWSDIPGASNPWIDI